MYKKLYLLPFISFCVRGALIDAPAEVLFTWENRTTLPNEKGETFTWTKEAAREHWNRIWEAGELKFSRVRDMVLASCEQLPVRLGEPKILRDHANPSFLKWSSDGRLLSANFENTYVNVRNRNLDRIERVLHGDHRIKAVAWSPDGGKIAVSNGSDKVNIYAVEDVGSVALPWGDLNPDALAWISKNNLAGIGPDRKIEVLDTLTGEFVRSFKVEDSIGWPRALVWDAQDVHLAYGEQSYSSSPCVRIWDAKTGKLEKKMHIDTLWQLVFVGWDSRDVSGNTLEVGMEDGQIFSVDLVTKAVKSKLKLPIISCISMAKSGDGRIAAGLEDGTIKVWTDYGEVLRKYFAKDMIQLMRERDENRLSSNQAMSQMLMTALFFDLKQKGKALKISEVVKEINKRADEDITTAEELAQIRDSFPDLPRAALQNVFNISQ